MELVEFKNTLIYRMKTEAARNDDNENPVLLLKALANLGETQLTSTEIKNLETIKTFLQDAKKDVKKTTKDDHKHLEKAIQGIDNTLKYNKNAAKKPTSLIESKTTTPTQITTTVPPSLHAASIPKTIPATTIQSTAIRDIKDYKDYVEKFLKAENLSEYNLKSKLNKPEEQAKFVQELFQQLTALPQDKKIAFMKKLCWSPDNFGYILEFSKNTDFNLTQINGIIAFDDNILDQETRTKQIQLKGASIPNIIAQNSRTIEAIALAIAHYDDTDQKAEDKARVDRVIEYIEKNAQSQLAKSLCDRVLSASGGVNATLLGKIQNIDKEVSYGFWGRLGRMIGIHRSSKSLLESIEQKAKIYSVTDKKLGVKLNISGTVPGNEAYVEEEEEEEEEEEKHPSSPAPSRRPGSPGPSIPSKEQSAPPKP